MKNYDNPGNETESKLIERDVRISEWYIYQKGAIDVIAYEEYDFCKLTESPSEIIKIQKNVIRKYFENMNAEDEKESQLEKWIVLQKKAFNTLNPENETSLKKINKKRLSDFIEILDKQEIFLKKIRADD